MELKTGAIVKNSGILDRVRSQIPKQHFRVFRVPSGLGILKKRQIRHKEEEAHSSEDPDDLCVMLCCDQLIHQTIQIGDLNIGLEKLIVSDRDATSGNLVG